MLPPSLATPSVEQLERLTEPWAAAIEFLEEGDDELVRAIGEGRTERVRYADPSRVPEAVRRAAAEAGLFVADAPVCAVGRVELLWYALEQSISSDYHRYGNLGERADEPRSETL